MSKRIESMVKNLPEKKSSGPDAFISGFYQTCKEELIPFLLKFFQKSEENGTLPHSFYKASITRIPKLEKYT